MTSDSGIRARMIPALRWLLLLLLAGCASNQNVQQISRLESVKETPRVLLMPPDIRYYLITAGGVPEPQAEWTLAAQENFRAAILEFADDNGTELVVREDSDLTPAEIEYNKLHEAVGAAVLSHHFGARKLPSKNGAFDWSLGPGVTAVAEDSDADYGLFVFYRDEQASGGRVALAMIAAAAAGAYVDTGGEYGFASLVDLQSGDIVWFNVVTAGSGELRDEAGAVTAVNRLLRDMPGR